MLGLGTFLCVSFKPTGLNLKIMAFKAGFQENSGEPEYFHNSAESRQYVTREKTQAIAHCRKATAEAQATPSSLLIEDIAATHGV